MAISPIAEYVGKVTPATTDYPYGKAQNITIPGDGTGTPWEAKLVNDIFGFQQFLLDEAGITPSGTPDNATTSQYFAAVWKLLSVRTVTHNITVNANYTLTAAQNIYAKVIITDTGVLLTAARDIVIDAVGRFILFTNSTAQILTVKVSGGAGVAVPAGVTTMLVSNGVTVSLLQTATPTTDYQLANKKYVDDNAGEVLASTAQAQAQTDNVTYLSPLKLKEALQGANQSLVASGYQKLPGGLIIQWGTGAGGGNNTSSTKVFPISFPNAVFSVATVPFVAGVDASDVVNVIGSLTVSSFLMNYNTSGTAAGFKWMAIGY
jgi:hypothetical protein